MFGPPRDGTFLCCESALHIPESAIIIVQVIAELSVPLKRPSPARHNFDVGPIGIICALPLLLEYVQSQSQASPYTTGLPRTRPISVVQELFDYNVEGVDQNQAAARVRCSVSEHKCRHADDSSWRRRQRPCEAGQDPLMVVYVLKRMVTGNINTESGNNTT
ncbi:uncharacterized protein BDV17DRAFT_278086 [Aspergillus undulatus]|uniref:uncharacterized protein n=1 Tax=Aspergillus undulatus TaxID=1810928 RepID=UPI003CCCBCE9